MQYDWMTQFLMVRQNCQCWPRFFSPLHDYYRNSQRWDPGNWKRWFEVSTVSCVIRDKTWKSPRKFPWNSPKQINQPHSHHNKWRPYTTTTLQKALVLANKCSKMWIKSSQKYMLNIQHKIWYQYSALLPSFWIFRWEFDQ